MSDGHDPDPVVRSDRLDEKLNGSVIEATVQTLMRSQGRNRRVIRILAFSLAVDVLLSVAIGFGHWRLDRTVKHVQATAATQQAFCESSNEGRRAQRQLWGYILDLSAQPQPGQPPRTEEQVRRAEAFGVYVNDVFKDRDC